MALPEIFSTLQGKPVAVLQRELMFRSQIKAGLARYCGELSFFRTVSELVGKLEEFSVVICDLQLEGVEELATNKTFSDFLVAGGIMVGYFPHVEEEKAAMFSRLSGVSLFTRGVFHKFLKHSSATDSDH